MKRGWVAAVVVLAAAGGAVAAWALYQQRARVAWSTDSPAALAAFEAGEEAVSRLYLADAGEKFRLARRLDPGFMMPKLMLAWHRELVGRGEREALLAELRQVDDAGLQPRERFLLAYHLALIDRRDGRAAALLERYLDAHPDDPYAVDQVCDRHWVGGEWDAARDCYRRLIELDPNRLQAQNRIGYVSMATGDFANAEQQFEIYRYLAPDQANPYDSLGELMMITGRYQQAEAHLRRALALKPDFCSSWRNLVRIRLLEGDAAGAAAVVEELEAAAGAAPCRDADRAALACELGVWGALLARDWEAAWQQADGCPGEPNGHLAFLAALYSGRRDEAAAITRRVHERMRAAGTAAPPVLTAVVDQQQALAALHAGDAATAVRRAEAADRRLRYWSLSDQWLLKLLNAQLLADSLAAAGRAEEAARARAALAEVNPRFAARPAIPMPAVAAPPAASATAAHPRRASAP